jgi:hypothetical protein
MNGTEQWREEQILVATHLRGQAKTFVTLTWAGNPSPETMEKDIQRFLLKLSRYSGSHSSALVGFECKPSHKHAHLILITDKDISVEHINARWKKGRVLNEYQLKKSYQKLNSAEEIRASTHYLLNHPQHSWMIGFCPNPTSCKSPTCNVHQLKRK